MPSDPPTFSARTVPGAKRGRKLGTPTINVRLADVPKDLAHGIYACFAQMDDATDPLPAVMHYGPRPVFKDSVSCEVHILDRKITTTPKRLTVAVVEHIRDVADFPLREVLQEQMASDIRVARDILGVSSSPA